MLFRDSLTGALSEVPDVHGYGEYGDYGEYGEMPWMPPHLQNLIRNQQWWRQRKCPYPMGWVTPALPYTGTLPRRLYLRCSVWPGPKGLVPASAAAAVPGSPAAAAQAAAAQAAAAAAAGGGGGGGGRGRGRGGRGRGGFRRRRR